MPNYVKSTSSIQCDWPNAIKYADILRKQCAWSPAIYCYQSAIFMHMMMDETGDERLREKINELYKEVPKLRIRYAGKTIPGERAARLVGGSEVAACSEVVACVRACVRACVPAYVMQLLAY